MDSVIHEFTMLARDDDGHLYRARALGRERPGGTWIGWLEFRPSGGAGVTRQTDRETTQPNRLALRYWALGLDEVYLEGALKRAPLDTKPEVESPP